jgi:hypothetical protein
VARLYPPEPGYLGARLNQLSQGDYCVLLAYIEMNEARGRELQEIVKPFATSSGPPRA